MTRFARHERAQHADSQIDNINLRIVSDSYICKDRDGNIFISFEQSDENFLSMNPLFTHCPAVVKTGDDCLWGWYKWRKRHEIFGGCLEKEETARDCIIRKTFFRALSFRP